jgi:hypothetical protein
VSARQIANEIGSLGGTRSYKSIAWIAVTDHQLDILEACGSPWLEGMSPQGRRSH